MAEGNAKSSLPPALAAQRLSVPRWGASPVQRIHSACRMRVFLISSRPALGRAVRRAAVPGYASPCRQLRGVGKMQMLDIYTHIFPDAFFAEMNRASPNLGNIGN